MKSERPGAGYEAIQRDRMRKTRREAGERDRRERRRIERDKRQQCVCWDYETPDAPCTCGAMD